MIKLTDGDIVMEKFSYKYDSLYKSDTMEWLEPKCEQADCQFCSIRPDKVPDNIEEQEKEYLGE